MGYSLAVERVEHDGHRHVYAYGREGVLDAYLTLDLDQGQLYPSAADGTSTSSSWVALSADSQSRGDLPRESWERFVEAAAGVLKRLRKEGAPPQTAHQIYG